VLLFGGEGGVRTLDTLLTYTHFPGVRLQPLGHLTKSFSKPHSSGRFREGRTLAENAFIGNGKGFGRVVIQGDHAVAFFVAAG